LWYGAALLLMFLAYVTAKGELPIYLGFFVPQGTATAPPGAQATAEQASNPTGTFISPELPQNAIPITPFM
jgi:hypothetical protein